MCSRFNFTLIKMVHRGRDEGCDDRDCYIGGCQRIVIVSAFLKFLIMTSFRV